jgi:glycosyltransferase involved in cell wall biosynthesis
MEIDYISGPQTDRIFGMSKYQREIRMRLHNVDYNDIRYQSLMKIMEDTYRRIFPNKTVNDSMGMVPILNNTGILATNPIFKRFIDISWKITTYTDRYRYRQIVEKKIKTGNIKHIIYQELAYLLKSISMANTIVNCHDLIPWVFDKDRSLMWRNNIAGLKKAGRIITGSEFSKREIVHYLNYPPERVHVIPDAVDQSIYYPKRDKRVLKQLDIPESHKVILYVGSETPRMNLPTILKAIHKLKKRLPNIKLLKIGDPQKYGARESLLRLIKELNLERDVIFTGYVPEEELPKFYNVANLLVYPCLYAGFGLPPLEAMACGTPVITSNTTSLPEVVGEAGLMIDPYNVNSWTDKMYEVLTNQDLINDLVNKGLNRCKTFDWEVSVKKTFKIYQEINNM